MRFKSLILILVGMLFCTPLIAKAFTPLQGSQGGTGFATTTAGNIGNCPQVLTNNPLTYTFGACSGGSISGGVTGLLASWSSATTLTTTSTPTVAAIFATSTNATSTFAGGLQLTNLVDIPQSFDFFSTVVNPTSRYGFKWYEGSAPSMAYYYDGSGSLGANKLVWADISAGTADILTLNRAGLLTMLAASSTNFTSTNIWEPGQSAGCAQYDANAKLTSTGVNCGGGTGAGWPLTPGTNFGQNDQSTTTLISFKGAPFSLVASSTAVFVNASTTALTAGLFNGTVSVNGVNYPQTSAGIQSAINVATLTCADVFLPAGTYTMTTRVTPANCVHVHGAGTNAAILKGGVVSDYQFYYSSSVTPLTDFSITDVTIDLNSTSNGSGIRFNDASSTDVSRVAFKNGTTGGWYYVLGAANGLTDGIVNTNNRLSDVTFYNHPGTLESLLVFNARNTVITRPNFYGDTSPSLGLWQKDYDTTINDAYCLNGTGKFIYYSITVDHTTINNPHADNCSTGVSGANVSDNGNFGTSQAEGLKIVNAVLTGGANSTTSTAIQLGAVNDVTVVNPLVQGYEIAVALNGGNNSASSSPTNWSIIGGVLKNNNADNVVPNLHPAIYISTSTPSGLQAYGLIQGVQIYDDQVSPTQKFPIVFDGALVYDGVKIIDNRLSAGTGLGGTSIGLFDNALLGANIQVGNNSNYTGAATVQTYTMFGSNFGIATSTPFWSLTVATSSGPQLALVDTIAADFAWSMRSIANNFYLATSTALATSTTAALAINSSGDATFEGAGTFQRAVTINNTGAELNLVGTGDVLNFQSGSFIFNQTNGTLTMRSGFAAKTLQLKDSNSNTRVTWNLDTGSQAIGTSTTIFWPLVLATSTLPQLVLTDGIAANTPWTFRTIANSLFVATSTAYATSSITAFSINPNGIPTFSGLAGGSTLCVQASATGQLSLAAAACGTGGGGADPFNHNYSPPYSGTTSPLMIGTSTPGFGQLTIGTSTKPQLALSDNVAADYAWTLSSLANSFYLATSSAIATSTTPIITINATGTNNATTSIFSAVQIGTTSNATSTAAGMNAALFVSNALNNLAGIVIRTWTNVTNAFSVINAGGSTVFNIDTTATVAGWGIGSTTPYATLSVVGDGTNPLFAVATSTGGAAGSASSTQPIFMIDNNYHIVTGGPQPTFSSCGTTPSITGNDNVMIINTGSVGLTECIVNFAKTWNLAPVCTPEEQGTTASVTLIASSSATQLRLGLSASLTGATIGVQCMGIQ